MPVRGFLAEYGFQESASRCTALQHRLQRGIPFRRTSKDSQDPLRKPCRRMDLSHEEDQFQACTRDRRTFRYPWILQLPLVCSLHRMHVTKFCRRWLSCPRNPGNFEA